MGCLGMSPLLLASSFRASDHLIPTGADEDLRGNCGPPPLASKSLDAQALKAGQLVVREAENAPSLSASTVSIPEAYSPSQRRRRSGDWGKGGPAAASRQPIEEHGRSSPSSAQGWAQTDSPPVCLISDSPAAPASEALPQDAAAEDSFFPQRFLDGSGSSLSLGGAHTGSVGGSQKPDMQQRIDVLESRLLAETEARQALQRRMAQERSEAERQLESLGAQYEERMAALRQELQQAAANGGAGAHALSKSLLAGSQQLTLSLEEQEALRRQLAEQELLIKAFQAENELAIARMRQQAAESQRQAATAAAQIDDLQRQLVLAHCESERHPAITPEVDAARLQELLRLQAELEAAHTAASQQELELLQQVEQLRGGQNKLQQRVQELQADSANLAEVRQQLAESDSLVRQQAQVILQLEQQLQHDPNSNAGSGLPRPVLELAGPQQRQQQLEAENASLQKAVHNLHMQLAHQQAQQANAAQSTHGTAASGPAGSEPMLAELQIRVTRLQGSLKLKEEQHQRQLRSLRQEHEKLRVQESIRAASRSGAARVKELEAELERVQEAAARKLRMLESRLKEAEVRSRRSEAVPGSSSGGRGDSSSLTSTARPQGAAAAPGMSSSSGKSGAAQEALLAANTQLQQKEQRIRRLESEVARKDTELAAMTRRAALADEQLNEAAEKQQATVEEVAALRQAVEEVTAANSNLQSQVKQTPALRQQLSAAQKSLQELQEQVERLQEAETQLASLRQEQTEAAQQAASREAQHAAELRCLQRQQAGFLEQGRAAGRAAAAEEWRPQLEKAEQAAAEWQNRVGRLEQDLRSARAGLPWTPTAAEFDALERRMVKCQQAAEKREAHWRQVAEDSKRAAEMQQLRLQQQYEATLTARDQQVKTALGSS